MSSTTWDRLIDDAARKRAEHLLYLVNQDESGLVTGKPSIPECSEEYARVATVYTRQDLIVLIALTETMLKEQRSNYKRVEILLTLMLIVIIYAVLR